MVLLLVGFPVELQLAPHGIADASFQAAEPFSCALALTELAPVVGTARGVVADLGDGGDVDGVVEPAVPRPAQSMSVVVAR